MHIPHHTSAMYSLYRLVELPDLVDHRGDARLGQIEGARLQLLFASRLVPAGVPKQHHQLRDAKRHHHTLQHVTVTSQRPQRRQAAQAAAAGDVMN